MEFGKMVGKRSNINKIPKSIEQRWYQFLLCWYIQGSIYLNHSVGSCLEFTYSAIFNEQETKLVYLLKFFEHTTNKWTWDTEVKDLRV
jgi:hypothetical protein